MQEPRMGKRVHGGAHTDTIAELLLLTRGHHNLVLAGLCFLRGPGLAASFGSVSIESVWS